MELSLTLDSFRKGGAWFSSCGLYRYQLDRVWSGGPHLGAILLNPSTADAEHDDPTTTFMVNQAKRMGYGRYTAANLFGLIATDPKAMRDAEDPIGPENEKAIWETFRDCDALIVAWGNGGRRRGHNGRRDAEVLEMLRYLLSESPKPIMCFGYTKLGSPRFPRALRKDVDWITCTPDELRRGVC